MFLQQFPESASNVHFEFYSDVKKEDEKDKVLEMVSIFKMLVHVGLYTR